jgi:hypothetical protein
MDSDFSEHDMRTAIRQAHAITSLAGGHTLRDTLNLADALYEAMVELAPRDRARRVRLIDAVFGLASVRRNRA